MSEHTIPVSAWVDFQAAINKLNKKAKRFGTAPITVQILRTEKVTRKHTIGFNQPHETTREYKVDAHVIELTGPTPKLNGWEFLARVENLDGGQCLFHSVPVSSGAMVDQRFLTLRAGTCEHCNKHRNRADTFVVRNVETGEQKQVGRQCLADFTGIKTPADITATFAQLHTFEQMTDEIDRCWRGWNDIHCDTLEALELTSAYITLFGWVPKAAADAGRPSTSSLVARHWWGKVTEDERAQMIRARDLVASDPTHKRRASEVIAWIKDHLQHNIRSDYERNLVVLVVNDLTESRHLGLVCSSVSTFLRHKQREAELNIQRKQLAASDWIGKKKERLRDIKATITMVRLCETVWGASTLIKFTTDEGNVIKWFASGDRDYTPGSKVTITGTVKDHGSYNDIRETVMSRVVIQD